MLWLLAFFADATQADAKDIDKNTAETMLMIFKSNTDDAEQFDIESSESDG